MANWARTSDLQLVELALSQLSYAPFAAELSRGLRDRSGLGGAGTAAASLSWGAGGAEPLRTHRDLEGVAARVARLPSDSRLSFSFMRSRDATRTRSGPEVPRRWGAAASRMRRPSAGRAPAASCAPSSPRSGRLRPLDRAVRGQVEDAASPLEQQPRHRVDHVVLVHVLPIRVVPVRQHHERLVLPEADDVVSTLGPNTIVGRTIVIVLSGCCARRAGRDGRSRSCRGRTRRRAARRGMFLRDRDRDCPATRLGGRAGREQ